MKKSRVVRIDDHPDFEENDDWLGAMFTATPSDELRQDVIALLRNEKYHDDAFNIFNEAWTQFNLGKLRRGK